MVGESSDPSIIGIDGDLPYSKQTDHYTCVPRCLWMVLEKIKKPGYLITDYTAEEIAKILKSSPHLATSYRDIEYLNEKLKIDTPIVNFKPSSGNKWDDIEAELKDKKPVIAYLKGSPNYRVAHAVVVTKYDPESDKITYVEPRDGEKYIYIGDFMEYWENAHHVLIPVSVGDVIQTNLDEIMEEE